MKAWVYILECQDGSYYTGWTWNVQKRFAAHCAGRGAKYTRSHPPLRIVYAKVFEDKSTALKQEAAIKKLTHAQKMLLISQTKRDLSDADDTDAQARK